MCGVTLLLFCFSVFAIGEFALNHFLSFCGLRGSSLGLFGLPLQVPSLK